MYGSYLRTCFAFCKEKSSEQEGNGPHFLDRSFRQFHPVAALALAVDRPPLEHYEHSRMKRALVTALFLSVLTGCEKPQPAETTPPPVSFAKAEAKDVPLTIDTFGNCVTIADVTLQAQVTGNLLKFAVPQGSMVKAGEVIAEIDPAPYMAALQEAQGGLDSAKASLANAQLVLARQQQLFKTKTIDLADLQTAEADELNAQGAVLSAEGTLATAQINLGYCTIKSPVDGKLGLYLVDAGNLVSADQTEIINVQTIDPIYVKFTISENDFDRVRGYFSNGELPVEVHVPGAPDNMISGKLTFLNNNIASDTGTLMLEATFPNSETRLWPGLFVNVRLVLTTLKAAIVIPSPCVLVGQQGPYVFVIAADNTVTQRNVTIGQQHQGLTVVSEGVADGDRVVTAGQLGLVTGKKVTPAPWQPASSAQ